ncbi:MAG: hypothetical protein WBE72_10320 [Terracidiphilus sp.]
MSESDERIERAILKVIGDTGSHPKAAALPPPIDSAPGAAAAIARCRDTWQQAYDLYMKKNARRDGSLAEYNAQKEAAAAYCAATPQLAGFHGIRDFIACIADGVLIDAIPSERTGQLLYAAQTALSLLPRSPNL